MGTMQDRQEKGPDLVLPGGMQLLFVGFPGHLAEPCLPAEGTLGRAGASSVPLMTTLGLVSTLPQSCGCICSPEGAELEGAVLYSLPAVHLHGGP